MGQRFRGRGATVATVAVVTFLKSLEYCAGGNKVQAGCDGEAVFWIPEAVATFEKVTAEVTMNVGSATLFF